MQHLIRIFLACGAVAAVACDSTSPTPSGIGSTGGTASSPNSAAQVVIPPGALAANTVVTVAPASSPPATPGLVAASAFDFGPSGTKFTVPVTITIKYDPASIPAGVAESSLQLYTMEGTTWTPVAGSAVNVGAHTVSGATTHFSLYAPVGVVGVSTVSVTAPATTLTVGSTLLLTGQAKDASGSVLTGRAITWSSSDVGRATVSPTGLVTGVATGAVTITATSEGKTGTVSLTVTPVPVASVAVAPSTAAINVGATSTLAATTKDAAGNTLTGRTVTWTSSDAGKATVSAAGVVTGVAVGSATITATSEGVSGTAVVTVSAVVAGASVPVQLQAISTGDNHACGLNATGAAYCWGYNGNNALGDGKSTDSAVPVAAVGGFTYASIGADANLSCGITAAAVLYCWGGGSQLFGLTIPMEVASGIKFASVSVNSNHTCGVATDGTGYCVGSNLGGVLGIGSASPASSSTFLPVSGGFKWKQLASTNVATCGITSDGALYCWGNIAGMNSGTGAVSSSNAPVLITSAVAFTSLTQRVGTTAVCGLTATGAAYCVGSNIAEFGAATGSTSQTPQRVGGTTTFKSLSYAGDNLCGVTTADALVCWGSNGRGQLGQGASGAASTTPLVVMTGQNFSAVDLNDEQTVCAVATDGKGYCWGYNFYGQIGDGTKVNRGAPTLISGGLTFRVP